MMSRTLRDLFASLLRAKFAGVLGLCLLVAGSPRAIAQSRTASLGIDTQAEYDAFLDAIRASEYVRQGFIVGDGTPRQIAVVAGLAAFADLNPLATADQFDTFVQGYDAVLGVVVPGDADLRREGSLVIGLTAARVDAEGMLDGMNTRVATRAIELLGFGLPGLDGLEQAQRRMTRFDRATVSRLANSSAFAEVLITNLLGVDETGTARDGLSAAVEGYLEFEGYAPMLGMVDPAQAEVNAGLAGLPDFATYQGLVADPDPSGFNAGILGDLETVRVETQGILSEIGASSFSDSLMQDSVETAQAAGEGDAAALAELAAIEAEVRARAQAVSEQRARMFASTLILMQSEYPEVQFSAERARDFGSIQLQVNNEMAKLKAGLDTAGSIVGLAAAIYTGDAWGATQSAFDLVGNAIGLGEEFGLIEQPPSVDEQVFAQVVELRQQVEDLRVEMNARFDLVDQKLDTIFDTMVAGFGQLGDQIGDLTESVDDIAFSIFELRSELSRLEESLFLLAEAEFLDLLNVNAELALDYRNDTGQDLPYSQSATNFVDAGIDFLSFATFTSENAPFIDPSITITLENADEELGDGAVSRAFGALNTVPLGLTLADGTPYAPGPFVLADLPAPAAWSQPAAMYAQLARENPWYFAYQYANQRVSNPGETNLDRILANGETIRNFALSARDPLLFEALIENARASAEDVQVAMDGVVAEASEAVYGLNAGGGTVDPWGGLDQGDFSAHVPPRTVGSVVTNGTASTFFIQGGLPKNGYSLVAGNEDGLPDGLTRQQLIDRVTLARLLNAGPDDTYSVTLFRTRTGSSSTRDGLDEWFLSLRLSRPSGTVWRIVRELQIEYGRASQCTGVESLSALDIQQIMKYFAENYLNQLAVGDINEKYPIQVPFLIGWCNFTPDYPTVTVTSDTTYVGTFEAGDKPNGIADEIAAGLLKARRDVARPAINAEMLPEASTALNDGIEGLNDAEALLDAYATLALDVALTRSEVLRSALRGFSSVGFRRENVLKMMLDAELSDAGALGGAPEFDVPTVDVELGHRLDLLKSELDAALAQGGPTFPYVEFVLAELERLELEAFDLATDDTYETDGALSVNVGEGLLANDVLQPGRSVVVDQAFFAGPDAVLPQHGAVSVNNDGSFTYTPDPGFNGVDTFNYRLTARVDDSANPVGDPNAYSDPADVVVRVGAAPCTADINGDSVLDLGDINAFVALFLAADPAADTNGDGVLDLGDIGAFVDAFLAGC